MDSQGDSKHDPDDADRQLDRAIEALRGRPIPPTPNVELPRPTPNVELPRPTPNVELPRPAPSSPRHRTRWVVVALAIAASIAALVVIDRRRRAAPEGQPVPIAGTPQTYAPITASDVALTEPLDRLLAMVDQLEAELSEMDGAIEMVDTRQQADRLVTEFRPIRDAL